MKASYCLPKHFGAKSPINAYRADMADDVPELVSGGKTPEAAWVEVAQRKLGELTAERTRIEQVVADAYAKRDGAPQPVSETGKGKPAPAAPEARPYVDMTDAEKAAFDAANGITPGQREDVAKRLEQAEPVHTFKSRKNAEAEKKRLGNEHKIRKTKDGFILRRKSDAELAAEARAGRRLTGRKMIDTANDPLLTAIAKLGGLAMSEKADTIGEGNKNAGGAMVFRDGGRLVDEMASVLKEYGYIPTDEYEEDGGVRWLQDAVSAEFSGRATYYSEIGGEDRMEAARLAAQGDEPDYGPGGEFDADSMALDDFDLDELDEAGYSSASPEVQAATEAMLADAEAAGIDTEAIREDAARATDGQPDEAYHAQVQQAARDAIAGVLAARRANAAGDEARRPGEGGEGDGGPAGGEGAQEGLTPAGDPLLAMQTPDDLRAKSEREAAAAQAEKDRQAELAARDAKAKRERNRAEVDARAAQVIAEREAAKKAEIDAGVEDFQLGQEPPKPVERKVSLNEAAGQADIFGQPAEQAPAPPPIPATVRSRVKAALDTLRDIERELAEVQRVGGAVELRNRLRDRTERIDTAQARLVEFRDLAKGKGLDADAVIAELGGEPGMGRFGTLLFSIVDAAQASAQTPADEQVTEDQKALFSIFQRRMSGFVGDARAGMLYPRAAGSGSAKHSGRTLRSIAAIAKEVFGHEVVYVGFKGAPLFNGAVSDAIPNTVFLWADSQRPLLAVLGHELLHKLRASNESAYRTLASRLNRLLRGENRYRDKLEAAYKAKGLELPLNWAEELHADIVGDFFTDPQFWADMAGQQPRLFKRAADAIIKFLDDVAQKIAGFRPFGTEQYLTDIAEARKAVVQAMGEFGAGQKQGATAGAEQFSPAWHGTPHRGIKKFDTSKIGTGEGAQAYGWGLYFASKREIAEHYRKVLAEGRVLLDGEPADGGTDIGMAARLIADGLAAGKTFAEAKADISEQYAKYRDASLREAEALAKLVGEPPARGWGTLTIEESDVQQQRDRAAYYDAKLKALKSLTDGRVTVEKGQLYEVEVPEDTELLNWDKPLSEQPEKVREAARSMVELIIAKKGEADADVEVDYWRTRYANGPAASIYKDGAAYLGGDKAASDALAAAGIKGIKYLDGTSRNAGDGTHNYVIFSGDDVAIQAEHYSIAAPTDSAALKAFMAGSVVTVDGKPGSEPLVVHHGTDRKFTVFDTVEDGAFFFGGPESRGGAAMYGKNIVSAYLSIKNPYRASLYDLPGTNFAELAKQGFDGAIFTDYESGQKQYVVFKPEQIKSATGNRGTFDAGNPDIRFSIADTLNTAANNAKDVKLPAGYKVADLFNGSGKLNWWHKTVGTQYNLAQRSVPFKRVFDAVQSFLNDVSYYATEAADLAPNILPKLEGWRDIAKTPLSAEDTKAVSAPIFEGTLIWARDESGKPVKVAELEAQAAAMDVEDKAKELVRRGFVKKKAIDTLRLDATSFDGLEKFEAFINDKYEDMVLKPGVVWTDAELKSLFKLDAGQIGLYREFRKSINKSLTNLAISDMLRFGGSDVASLTDQAMADATPGDAAERLRDHLLDLADSEPDRAELLQDTAQKIMDKGYRAADLMARGYAPLSRFGKYTVYVTQGGEQVYFGMFESSIDASRMARKMRDEYPDANVQQGTVSDEAFKLFAGVSPETLELFGDMLGLEADAPGAGNEAFQTYLKVAKANRSSMKRLIERKGIAGFSEDAGRVLAGFVYSNARQTAGNLHMGEMTRAATEIDKNEGELKDAAVRLTEYIRNPVEEAHAFRGLLFAQYLGGSVASAMVNATQPLAVTFPYLSQFGGIKAAAAQMTAAVRDAAKGKTGDARLDAALKKAEEEGIVSPQETHQLMAQAMGSASLKAGDGTMAGDMLAKGSNFMSKLGLAWGQVFGVAEQFNRRITFIAAYRTAVAQGKADPAKFAAETIAATQFVYNKGNKPRWARGAIGGTLFTFKTYSVSYLELLARMYRSGPEGKKAALLALAVLFLMSGMDGLPGAEDLEDLIDGVMQRLGYNFSTKRAKREFFSGVLGDAGAQFVANGLSGLPGAPIDVSRMGLGNLVPGTGLFTKKEDHTRDFTELLGPAGDFSKRILTAVGQVVDRKPVEAIGTISPVAIRNAVKAYDMATTGMYRDDRGRKVIDSDGYEAAAKAIGFQPNSVARVQEAAGQVQQMIALNKVREGEIAEKWARGIFEKDPDKIRSAREELARWNADNPDAKIAINTGLLLLRVRNMAMSKDERIAKTAPLEIRRSVRQELEAAR